MIRMTSYVGYPKEKLIVSYSAEEPLDPPSKRSESTWTPVDAAKELIKTLGAYTALKGFPCHLFRTVVAAAREIGLSTEEILTLYHDGRNLLNLSPYRMGWIDKLNTLDSHCYLEDYLPYSLLEMTINSPEYEIGKHDVLLAVQVLFSNTPKTVNRLVNESWKKIIWGG